MASFARSKMTFQDDCYPDKPEVPSINLVGPNVPKLYQMIYDAMKNTFFVLDNNIEEEDFSWGKSGDQEKFSVRWYVHKDIDYFTFFWLRVDLKGSGNENNGKATAKIKAVMRTDFPQDTLWQRSLLYEMIRTFWHRTFYHKKRVQYRTDCRDIVGNFMKSIVREFREMNESSNGFDKVTPNATVHQARSSQTHPQTGTVQSSQKQPAGTVHRPPAHQNNVHRPNQEK